MLIAPSQFSHPVFSNPRSSSCTNIIKSNHPRLTPTVTGWLFSLESVTLTVQLIKALADPCPDLSPPHWARLWQAQTISSLPKRITTPFRRWANAHAPEDTLSTQVWALITCNAFWQLCAQHLVHPAPIATAVIHLWNSTERRNTLSITSSHLSSAFHSEPQRLWDFRRQWDQTYHKIILRTSSKQSLCPGIRRNILQSRRKRIKVEAGKVLQVGN